MTRWSILILVERYMKRDKYLGVWNNHPWKQGEHIVNLEFPIISLKLLCAIHLFPFF